MFEIEKLDNKLILKSDDHLLDNLTKKIIDFLDISLEEWDRINLLERNRILTQLLRPIILAHILKSDLDLEANKRYIIELTLNNKKHYYSLVNLEPEKEDENKISLPYGYALDKITTLEANIINTSKGSN